MPKLHNVQLGRASISLRAFHHSSIQSSSIYEECYSELKNGLKYYTTRRKMRSLIYRPKNAGKLLGMEIYDEAEGQRIQPRTFEGSMKKSLLTNLFLHSKDYTEFKKTQDLMYEFAHLKKLDPSKNYLKEEHLINFLIAATKINKFPHALSSLHRNKSALSPFASTKLVEAIHVLNGIVKVDAIGAHCSLKEFVHKLYSPLRALRINPDEAFKQDPLVGLSMISALTKFGSVRPGSQLLVNKKIGEIVPMLNLEALQLPEVSSFNTNLQTQMLILEAVYQQLSATDETRIESTVEKIGEVVNKYRSMSEKEGKSTLYERVVAEAKFGRPATGEISEPAETAETESEIA